MNPICLNLFMKKLIRERGPTISARVCRLTFSTPDFDLHLLPKRASSKRIRANRFSLGWKIGSTNVFLDSDIRSGAIVEGVETPKS